MAESSKRVNGKPDSEKPTVEGQFEHRGVELNENINARLENPLFGYTNDEITAMAEAFCTEHDLKNIGEDVRKGAFLAQDPAYEKYAFLTEEEREVCRVDRDHSKPVL